MRKKDFLWSWLAWFSIEIIDCVFGDSSKYFESMESSVITLISAAIAALFIVMAIRIIYWLSKTILS